MLAAMLIFFASSVALFFLHRLRPAEKGPGWWTLGNACSCLGLLLLAFRGLISDHLSIVLANGLLVLGFCFILAGIRAFLNRGPLPPALWLFPVVEMGVVAWYSAVVPSHRVRLIATSLLCGCLTCAVVWELHRHGQKGRTGRLLPAQAFTLAVTAAYLVVILLRCVMGMAPQTPSSALALHPITTGTYIVSIVLGFLSTLGLFLMSNERLQQELNRQASHDPLTGIPNRRAFQMMSRHELGRARRTHEPMALMVLDLDHFKSINDRDGHAAGDMVLRDFSTLLAAAVRDQDIICRFGGEEFVALLPATPLAGAATLAERIRYLAQSRRLEIAGRKVQYTVSIGLVMATPQDACIESVIKRADLALYRAKSEGRNRVSMEEDTLTIPSCTENPS